MTDLTQTQIDLLYKFTANGGLNFVCSTKNHTRKRDFFLMSPDVHVLSRAGYIIQINSKHSNRVYMVTPAGYVLLDSLSEFMQEDDSPAEEGQALTQAQNDLLKTYASSQVTIERFKTQDRFSLHERYENVIIIPDSTPDTQALVDADYVYLIDAGLRTRTYAITDVGYEYLESLEDDSPVQSDYEAMLQCAGWIE